MIDREATERENKRLVVRLKFASLRQAAIVEDADLRAPRGIDRAFFAKLVDGYLASRAVEYQRADEAGRVVGVGVMLDVFVENTLGIAVVRSCNRGASVWIGP